MTAPMTPDEARLRELAEAATGGKWGAWAKSGVIQIDNRGGDGKNPAIVHWRGFDGNDLSLKANKANAAFIAAANPATILALIDALSAERERDEWRPIEEHDTQCSRSILLSDGRYVGAGWLGDDGYSFDADSDTGAPIDPQPTHFRPMPEPPLATQKSGGVTKTPSTKAG